MNGWPVLGVVAFAAVGMIDGPAAAQSIDLDLPAGPLGLAAEELAARTGINIVIADPLLWSRRVGRLRGRMTPSQAIGRLARQGRATAARIGVAGWRLVRRIDAPSRARPQPGSWDTPDAPEIVVVGSKRGATQRSLATVVERIADIDPAVFAGSQAIVLASTVVSSTYRGAGRDKLFVRGIADSAFVGQTQAVTGLYFGDLRLSYSASDPDLQLHDMESVEIIQGPQGTLYGSGSLAGVIRLNPRRPRSDRVEAAAGGGIAVTSYGSPSVEGDAMLNLPLDDRTAIRLVAYSRQDGGYIDKPVVGRDVNRVRIGGGRVGLRRTVGDDWTIDAVLNGQSVRARDAYYMTRGEPDLTSGTILAEPFASDYAVAQIVATGRVGGLDVTSSTGLSRQRLDERSDARETPGQGIIDSARRDNLLLHETRVASSGSDGRGWVAGVSLTGSNQRLDRWITLSDAQVTTRIDNRVAEGAVYGDGAFRPWRPLLLGGGLRAAFIRSIARPEGSDPLRPDVRRRSERVQAWLVPSLSALFRIFDGAGVFARYQQGFRPGVLVPVQGQVVDRMTRDELHSIEGGARFDNDVVTAELSIIRSRWKNIQGDYTDGAGPSFTTNIGDGRILSLNGRATWRAGASFRIDGAFTLNGSRLDRTPAMSPPAPDPVEPTEPADADPVELRGIVGNSVSFRSLERIPYVAGLIARVASRFRHEFGEGVVLDLNGWVRHEGRSAGAVGSVRTATQGPVWMTGLSATVTRDGTELQLLIDNPLDTRGARFVSGPSIERSSQLIAPPRPLTARIGVRRYF